MSQENLHVSIPPRRRAWVFVFLFGLILLAAFILKARALSSAERRAKGTAPPQEATLLQSSVPAIDFGTMQPAESHEITFWLSNSSRETVNIAAIETSCDCLQVRLARRAVAVGQKIKVVARLDLSKEPHFTGQLQLDIRGVTPNKLAVFLLPAYARVVKR